MVTLAVAQTKPSDDITANIQTLIRICERAADIGCAAICFPEAFLTGYFPGEAAELALPRSHSLLSQIAALARSQQIDLLVGFMEREETRFFLTHGLWRPDGTVSFYRKTHLGQNEQTIFSAGDCLEIFSLSCGLRVGIQLCVETHFPEITRTYSLGGAEVILAPHASPMTAERRRNLWTKYIPARSYDNRVYMACCNLWDPVRFGGGCMVTDPSGDILLSSFENAPGLLPVEIDPQMVHDYHVSDPDKNHHYYPGRRRPELYR